MFELLGLATAAYWVYQKISASPAPDLSSTLHDQQFVHHCHRVGAAKLPDLSFESVYAWAVLAHGDAPLSASDFRTIDQRLERAVSVHGIRSHTNQEQFGDICAALLVAKLPVWSALRFISAHLDDGTRHVYDARDRERAYAQMLREIQQWYGVQGTRREQNDYSASSSQDRGRTQPTQRMTMAEAYEVLGVSPCSTSDEIRAAYRRKVSEWHPDQLGRMAAELRAYATQQMQRINEAHDMLRTTVRSQ